MFVVEEIVWDDHYSTDDWQPHDNEDVARTISVTSIGYKIKENRRTVVLAQNVNNENKHISGTITIIKKNIKKRTIIREADLHRGSNVGVPAV